MLRIREILDWLVYAVMLSCYYEDDIKGPIGLYLEPFKIASTRDDIFALISLLPRLIVIDEDCIRAYVA